MDDISKRERQKLNRQEKKEEEKLSSFKSKIPVVGAIVLLAASVFWLMYRGGSSATSNTEQVKITPPSEVSENDHVKGPSDAIVTIVEYGDFQCPACAAYYPITNQISEEFKDDVRIVYRHFPLTSIHRHAQIAAQASEAAAEQGYFWEMRGILFTRQEDWANVRDPRSLFIKYADELAMDKAEFEKFMNSSEAKVRVDNDYKSAVAAGINSTPAFYVNGVKIENPQGLDPFRELIDRIVKKEKESKTNESTDSGKATPEGEVTPQL